MSLKLFSGCSARLNFFRTIQSEGRFQRWRSASTKADLKEQEKNSG